MSTNLVQQFVLRLKSQHRDVRNKAAHDLCHYIKTELRETTQEEITAFMEKFNQHIFEMVSGSDINEKKGGILGIICLIGADMSDINNRIRFANYLRNLLPSKDVSFMKLVAKTVGKLALVSGTYTAEYVEFEVKRAFEWLGSDSSEGKRHAAVLILCELANSMPTYFFLQVTQFFELIFNAVRDPKALIREGAIDALRAALVVIAQRETAKQMNKSQWYKQCYDEIITGFEDVYNKEKGWSLDDMIHGSLLILNELFRCSNNQWEKNYEELMTKLDGLSRINDNDILILMPLLKIIMSSKWYPGGNTNLNQQQSLYRIHESAACRQLLQEGLEDIYSNVMKQFSSRNCHIKHALITLLPRLIGFNTEKFNDEYLQKTLNYLLSVMRGKEKNRHVAFVSIGLIAITVKKTMKPYFPDILEVIRTSMKYCYTNLKPAIFICITLLGYAMKEEINEGIKDLLEPMFDTGLSPFLTTSLRELANNIPSLKPDISHGLLQILSQILMRKPLHHPGAPWTATSSTITTFTNKQIDSHSIILALKTLGTFDFYGNPLLAFVKRCANHFLESEQPNIRLEAVRTCSRLLKLALSQPGPTVTNTVSTILGKLLEVGISDTDPDVRVSVLSSLDQSFDIHLAQAENLLALDFAMNDEMFEIREYAIRTVARLSTINPAYVMSSLKKTLVHILMELDHSGMGRMKEQAAIMLNHLIVGAPRFIRPYMEPIMKILLTKLKEKETNPGVILAILRAIGNLAEVSGAEMQQWMPELLSILLEMLVDLSSPEKRGVALWVLGQLVESTGHVVKPYMQYPTLLEVLLNFLITEQQPIIRRETIRVLGLLGALDPYKHKENLGQINCKSDRLTCLADTESGLENIQTLTSTEMLVNMSSSSLDDYCPAIAISTLMKIIKDPTLSKHHTMVVQAITFIFKSLASKCVPFISKVMPSIINVVRNSEASFREFLFQQLATLILIVRQHIRNYLEDIFKMIDEFWTITSPLQCTLILLIEHIAIALGAEFKIYLPRLISQVLKVLNYDGSENRRVTMRLLAGLQKLGSNLDHYCHIILPPIVKLFCSTDCPIAVNKMALETVDFLADSLDLTEFASRIIHPLVRTLDNFPELRDTAMDTLCALIVQLKEKYDIFMPLVEGIMEKHRIRNAQYDILIERISRETSVKDEHDNWLTRHQHTKKKRHDHYLTSLDIPMIKRLQFSATSLQKAWTASRQVSKDDWLEWLRSLSIELLKESPSPALRSCLALAQTYSKLPKDLFNASFVSCWEELDQEFRVELCQTLQQALMVPDIPEITQTILNLAEFMERCDKGPLPIDIKILGERAMHCRAYAKALHFKEAEFLTQKDGNVIESLISINNKLQQKATAESLLEYVMKAQDNENDLKVQVRWYEKLHNWDKALNLHRERFEADSTDVEATLGEMRCLEALGEWGQLHEIASKEWENHPDDIKTKMATMAAAAAWGLDQWKSFEKYVSLIPNESLDGAFYRAVLAIHDEKYSIAHQLIDSARDLLDTELTAMAGESYQRAYNAMVEVQKLAELEEVIQFKLVPERRMTIKKMWWERLQGSHRNVEDWQKIIYVHTLVLPPQDDMYTWLKYASLCRKSGSYKLCHKALVTLLGVDPSETPDDPLPILYPEVTFAYCKHMWVANEREKAYSQLKLFVKNSLHSLAVAIPSTNSQNFQHRKESGRLFAKCYLKLGEWLEALEGVNKNSIPAILSYYSAATEHDPSWYKAWHAFAYTNFETVLFYKSQMEGEFIKDEIIKNASYDPSSSESDSNSLTSEHISRFTVPAVEGFFKSINLSKENSLQDTLRLLTLWFDYGQWPEVYDAIVDGIKLIEINTWLQVIPQLIARIDTPRVLVGRCIHHLLIDIGKAHPQALVYPLTVASKSVSNARKTAANKILKNMSDHSPTLVEQAVIASEELIRVAILWHELWYVGLEQASKFYFRKKNIPKMLECIEPIHAIMEKGPQTLKETSFHQAYGRDLMDAQKCCQEWKKTGNDRNIMQAWDIYYDVFRRISRQFPQLTILELQYVSPKLLLCRDLELAVPGSYVPGQPVVRIASFCSSMEVITSKQRPRKLRIKGSDGKDYMFLLKGHEDLRQDERVMQLFGLVNTLLLHDPETFRKNLSIQRYAIIPLSTNTGLISWVPHCDTLHNLIRDYREKKKILFNLELKVMMRMCPDYDHLRERQRLEVFEHCLEHTQGDDLAKLLWLKSPSSEVWFDRRTNYTRSLAVMSMVGYILGLGDRHPSNIMLDRLSGKILHIDFGDCFEVAMKRERFPETIPFRLTRMLIKAMEVTGIEGTYRTTCESVMSVLHRNKDSLMAVLEAFVYDPLLNWRLIDNNKNNSTSNGVKPGVQSMGSFMKNDGLVEVVVPVVPDKKYESNEDQLEALNKKALSIITRVREKLTGRDFRNEEAVSVQRQVQLLIEQATDTENLNRCYIGWCPFW